MLNLLNTGFDLDMVVKTPRWQEFDATEDFALVFDLFARVD